MRPISSKITLPAGVPTFLFKVPIQQLHNFVIKAACTASLGGKEIQSTEGLEMENGDITAFNWQDFRPNDDSELELWAISALGGTLSFLIWRRD